MTGFVMASAQTQYSVKTGDTVYSLAKKNNVSVDDLYKANPGLKESGLKLGSSIVIPKGKSDGTITYNTPVVTTSTYTVVAGDTLYSLARKNNLTEKELIALNPGLTAETLKVGQVIKLKSTATNTSTIVPPIEKKVVPQEKPVQKSVDPVTYITKKGDTAESIAKEFNITVEDLQKYNPAVKFNGKLKKGIALLIPVKEGVTAVEEPKVAKKEPKKDYSQGINVAYILPFNSKNYQATKVKSDIATDFYTGSLFALDSLANNGYKINVKVYDNSGTLAETQRILKEKDFSNTDLIIGPFNSENVHYVADYFKDKNIKIISPFSGEVSIVGRENLIKTSLSDNAIYEKVFSNIDARNPSGSIYIIGNQDVKLVSKLKAKYPNNKVMLLDGALKDYDLTTLPKKSTIILNTNSEKIAKEALTEFDKINVVDEYKANFIAVGYNPAYVKGRGTNASFAGSTLLGQLGLTVLINNYFNDNDDAVYNTKVRYKQKYNTLPNTSSSAGFDVSYYLIKDYLFSKPTAKKVEGIFNKLELEKVSNGGYENTGVFEINY